MPVVGWSGLLVVGLAVTSGTVFAYPAGTVSSPFPALVPVGLWARLMAAREIFDQGGWVVSASARRASAQGGSAGAAPPGGQQQPVGARLALDPG